LPRDSSGQRTRRCKKEAIEDTKKAIKLCRSYLQKKMKNTESSSKVITVSV